MYWMLRYLRAGTDATARRGTADLDRQHTDDLNSPIEALDLTATKVEILEILLNPTRVWEIASRK